MDLTQRMKTIANIRLAIELAGDGGMQPFTNEEYNQMHQLIDELETSHQPTEIENITIEVDDNHFNDFFTNDYNDYKKIIDKCYIHQKSGIVLKILDVPNNEYYDFEHYEFIYERFEEWLEWTPEDYNWLQEQTEDKYNEFKITPYANMNIASESMFHLGKNGKLYTSVGCDNQYYEFQEISDDEFQKIRNEAIKEEID